MKVKDKKNNFVIAGLVLFLIIIIFGQQGNTFAGASNMEAAEKPTIAELKLVLEEGYEMIKGKGGALEYVEEQIKQQQKDIEYAKKYQFGIGNKVRLAAIEILQKIKLLMENINKNIIKLYDLLKKLENDQNKLKPAENEQIKILVKSINNDLKKIDSELNKFNGPIFFITNPFTLSKKDLLQNERPALALAQQKVGDIRNRLKRFEDGVQLMLMLMPDNEPLEPDKQPDKQPVKPGTPATEAQLEKLREAKRALEALKEQVKEAREKIKMRP